jgi:uncharacterized protein YndB with AHSA1/START domain
MKLSAREDIEAPLDRVYEAVTDFDGFERQMLRRGIDVTRDDTLPSHEPGARWQARFTWRGRPHDMSAELVSIESGQGYAIESRSGGVICLGVVDLVALSKARTRLFVSLDVRPTTLSSRLLVQSLKLAKGSIDRRFKARVSELAQSMA